MVPLYLAVCSVLGALIAGGYIGWNLSKADDTYNAMRGAVGLPVICPICGQDSDLGTFMVAK